MPDQIKELIDAFGEGVQGTQDEALASVYQELRIVASSRLRQHKRGHTLDTTALVHETYLKLSGSDGKISGFNNRRHFFSTAAKAMRQILTDQARKRLAHKRGGEQRDLTLNEELVAADDSSVNVLALDAALTQLENLDPNFAEVVHFKYFGGFNLDEIAEFQGVSKRTVSRAWQKARAFLHAQMMS